MSDKPIANGWTEREAQRMSDHLDRKAWHEQEYGRGSDADLRRAERMSDATDPMHDARRERQAYPQRPEPEAVTLTRQGSWLTSLDGSTEARVSVGQSKERHHYSLEVSQYGGDSGNPPWSRSFASEGEARAAASARQSAALGDDYSPPAEAPHQAQEIHRESWAENYRARRSDAGQQVAEARTELQAVKSERRGQSL